MTTTEAEQGVMTAKVRIDLSAGVLEAEGSEDFIRELYEDFRERIDAAHVRDSGNGNSAGAAASSGSTASRTPPPERKPGAGKATGVKARTPVFLKDLDLATKGSRVGLQDFVKRYRKLKGAMEYNALFVYYLAKVAEIKPITLDHVYSCYKDTGAKPPTVLTQSLWDTARRKATIDTTSLENITLTMRGENWVEHTLEKAKKAGTD